MKNIIKLMAIAVILLIASCGSDKTKLVDNSPTINVKVSAPDSNSSAYLTASGKVEAVQNANLSTRNMGFVTKVHVNVGQKVTKGQLLISINSSDISAQKAQVSASIAEATAALKNAEKDYNRFKALFKENSASQKEMDDMTTNFEMAKARLESATQMKNQVSAQLSYSNITAPFSGVITGKFINNGDMAAPGMPLISIENPGEFQVIAMVPESEIVKIKKDAEVAVLVKSINTKIKGVVTEVSSSTKNTGGQYLVKIMLEKFDGKLLSGMFTSVQFPTENATEGETQTVLIPATALVNQGQLSGIYTLGNDNTALLRWLRIGKTYGDQVEVLSGLKADEQYIITADGKLFNGAKVTIQ